MDIVKSVKEILEQQNSSEKESKLEQLSDVFEYDRELNEANLVEGVQLLLAATLQEDDKGLKESFFHAINNAIVYQDIGDRINWDTLITSLPSLEKVHLEYALNVLGLSGQARYLPVLEKYTHHADSQIREWAQEAITETEYRIAHATDAQKHE